MELQNRLQATQEFSPKKEGLQVPQQGHPRHLPEPIVQHVHKAIRVRQQVRKAELIPAQAAQIPIVTQILV